MKQFNSLIIAIFSTCFLLPITEAAISQQVTNQPTSVLANNSLSPEQIRQLAQAVTVKVLSTNKGGSGVLISKQGQTYTVLTNAHVISNKGSYRIQTPDDKIYTATVINQGDSLKGNDLAILQFQSQENYQIVALASTSNVSENQQVFAAGFPDDSKELVISSGKISLLSTHPLVGGYQIGYTNEIKQGMSGGALLNQSGQLIGINGLTSNAILIDAYAYQDGTRPSAEQLQQLRQLSFAVPIQTLAKVAPNLAIIPPAWRNQQQIIRSGANTFVDKVDNIAQQITVQIDSKNNGNGSGVIIAKQGQIYYIATARHVVKNPDNYEIITPDGKHYSVQQENIFKPEGIDAALVKFTSNQTYSVATISKYNLSFGEALSKYNGSNFGNIETSWVFISGFPGEDKGKRKLSPGFLSVGERLVVNAESNPLSQAFVEGGYRLVYSNLSLPGMSGGPVLDVSGQVIGINAGIENRKISETEIGSGYGVPSSSILSLATQAGLKKESLKIVSTKPPSIKDSEIALLANNPLFAMKKPSANASENDWFQYANQMWRIKRFSETISVLQDTIKRKPDFYQAYFVLGAALRQTEIKDPEKALVALDKATMLKPDYYEAWKEKSSLLSDLKKYPLALAAIDKAIEYNDDDGSLYLFRSSILSNLKRYPDALATIDKAIQIQPFYLNYLVRGSIHLNLQDYQGVLADMNEVIKLQPDLSWAYAIRAAIRVQLKDSQGGLADINQAIQFAPDNLLVYDVRGDIRRQLNDAQGALADYTKVIAINPQFAEAYVGRGVIYAEQKKWDLALADYTKVIAINPQFAEAYVGRGVIYTEQKKWDLALADYTKAIAVNPQYAQAYNIRGDLYTEQKKWDLALADYTKAIAINPQDAQAYNNRGYLYTKQKKWDLALADYTKAIAINPQDAQAYKNRGDLYYDEQKKWDLALADYTKVIVINPQDAQAYKNRGDVYYQQKKWDLALADYSQAIKLQPDNANAYFGRGDIYNFQLKNYQAALADYNQGIKLQPDNAQAYFAQGNVRFQLKDYQGALADYSQAIKLQPDNPNTYFSRGVIYQKQGNDNAALSDYNQALAKDGKLAPAIINIGYIKYENGDVDGAIQQWEKAVQINSSLAEPQMALAVSLYAKGEQQKALNMAQAALRLDKSWADVEVLKENLWGTHLIYEARKLLANPSTQTFIKQ
ncbi:tetratricopeptide repeat protein [Nostoc sp. C117]|uniref:tetratricopeptide repeat protein n=1 Tax=Nostoc sp. C117 TaxID=3349875 RepID=UPI00370D43B3